MYWFTGYRLTCNWKLHPCYNNITIFLCCSYWGPFSIESSIFSIASIITNHPFRLILWTISIKNLCITTFCSIGSFMINHHELIKIIKLIIFSKHYNQFHFHRLKEYCYISIIPQQSKSSHQYIHLLEISKPQQMILLTKVRLF